MRYPPGHKEHSRERIVEAAARLFRSHGIASTGIDAVMGDVGLTAGAFYAHFKSKQVLVGEVVRKSFLDGRDRLLSPHEDGRKWVHSVFRRYVSRSHRDHADTACPLTTLLSELPRAQEVVQPIVTEEIEHFARLFEEKLDDGPTATPSRRQRALGLCAMMVGAVALARVVEGTRLSDEILSACRAAAASLIEPPPAT